MKKFLFAILILLSFEVKAQSYSYIPMDLDTTCFWVWEYHNYNGLPIIICYGVIVTDIVGDSTFNGYKYFKMRHYWTDLNACNISIDVTQEGFDWIREDTLAKILYNWNQDTIINFNLDIGDTLEVGVPSSYAPILVDSVTYDYIGGMNRRRIWGEVNAFPSVIFSSIEGVGLTINMPGFLWNEWATPRYTLLSYCKQNTLLYNKDTSYNTCVKPPKMKGNIGVLDQRGVNFKYIFQNNQLTLTESDTWPVKLRIYDLSGKIILQKDCLRYVPIDISYLESGIYVLHLENKKEVLNKKIHID